MVGGTWPQYTRGIICERKRENLGPSFAGRSARYLPYPMEDTPQPPRPRPRLPTREEVMMLNEKYHTRTSEEANAQADMLRRRRREEEEKLAQAEAARQA